MARSGGSIGEALRIIDEGDNSQTLGKQVIELLTVLVDKDRASLTVFPFPSKNREELSDFLSMLRRALRDMAASRSQGKCEMLFGDDAKIAELSKKVGMSTLLKAEIAVSELLGKIDRNLALANIKAEMAISLWNAFSQ